MEPIFIVGHGLAGALLTHSLIDEGFKVYCTDAAIDHSASRVAAGLINPFIGPKLNIPLDFRNCIEANIRFFKNWENFYGEKIFKEETLFRVFTSEHQVIKWKELSDSSEYAQSFVSEKNLNQMGIIGRWGAEKPNHTDSMQEGLFKSRSNCLNRWIHGSSLKTLT